MILRFSFNTGFGVTSFRTLMSASICAGVVPQHPPMILTPSLTRFLQEIAKSSGVILYTVSSFSISGRPAFGLAMTGMLE